MIAETDLDFPKAQCTNTHPPSVMDWSVLMSGYLWNQLPFKPNWWRIILADPQGWVSGTLFLRFRNSYQVPMLRWLRVWHYFFRTVPFCFCCCFYRPKASYRWSCLREMSDGPSFSCSKPNVRISHTFGKSIDCAVAFHQLHYTKLTWFVLMRRLFILLELLLQLSIHFFLQRTSVKQRVPYSTDPLIIAMCFFS